MAAVAAGVHQSRFRGQRCFGDERLTHGHADVFGLLVQAVAAGDVGVEVVDAVAAGTGAGFGVVVAEEAAAR